MSKSWLNFFEFVLIIRLLFKNEDFLSHSFPYFEFNTPPHSFGLCENIPNTKLIFELFHIVLSQVLQVCWSLNMNSTIKFTAIYCYSISNNIFQVFLKLEIILWHPVTVIFLHAMFTAYSQCRTRWKSVVKFHIFSLY